MRIGLFFLLSFALLLPLTTKAQEQTADPSFTVVEQQLEAVRKRDAVTAFSLIAPSLQQKYADAKAYFRSIRFKDHELYEHVTMRLLGSTKDDKAVLHRVELENRDGEKSVVLFRVLADETGQWRVRSAIELGRKDKAI